MVRQRAPVVSPAPAKGAPHERERESAVHAAGRPSCAAPRHTRTPPFGPPKPARQPPHTHTQARSSVAREIEQCMLWVWGAPHARQRGTTAGSADYMN